MKQIINIYRNWRIVAMLIIAAVATMLIASDNETTMQFAIAKTIGIALLFADSYLYLHWKAEGKMQEMDNITEED